VQPLGEDPALDRLAGEAVRAFAEGRQAGDALERALALLALGALHANGIAPPRD
jgi:hypothetical protein